MAVNFCSNVSTNHYPAEYHMMDVCPSEMKKTEEWKETQDGRSEKKRNYVVDSEEELMETEASAVEEKVVKRSSVATPGTRPTPKAKYFEEPKTFSTKKERGTPANSCPPRPPTRSAPPLSRIFPRIISDTTKIVTFKSRNCNMNLDRFCFEYMCTGPYFKKKFNIVERIGCGSYGEVFKAQNYEDGIYYAVKKTREPFNGNSDRIRRFQEVAKYEGLPEHPNCVKFIKAWEEGQHLYIQTELCKTSLFEVAKYEHNFKEKRILNYMVDLLLALAHLHKHGVVHMDVKPENIFITEEDTCKLGDYGLMFHLDSTCKDHTEGDSKYLAPELMNGCFGKHADIFSLGLTILELAMDLEVPQGGDLWHKLRNNDLPNLAETSEELYAAMSQMLHSDYEKRPSAESLLKLPFLHEVAEVRKLIIPPPPKSYPVVRPPTLEEKEDGDKKHQANTKEQNGNPLKNSTDSPDVSLINMPGDENELPERLVQTEPTMRTAPMKDAVTSAAEMFMVSPTRGYNSSDSEPFTPATITEENHTPVERRNLMDVFMNCESDSDS